MRVKRETALIAILGCLTVFAGCAVERERAEARTLATRVHAKMREGDFAALYNESAPRFKTVGTQSEFVARMKETQEQLGTLRSASEIIYQTRIDSTGGRTHVLVFDLEYDHARARENLVFVRSESGKLELWKLDIQPVN